VTLSLDSFVKGKIARCRLFPVTGLSPAREKVVNECVATLGLWR
jgi:hypothetical protein